MFIPFVPSKSGQYKYEGHRSELDGGFYNALAAGECPECTYLKKKGKKVTTFRFRALKILENGFLDIDTREMGNV